MSKPSFPANAEGLSKLSRRSFLAGVVGASVPFVASAEPQTMTAKERCGLLAEQLNAELQALHGGEWKFKVDHELHVAFCVRKFRQKSEAV